MDNNENKEDFIQHFINVGIGTVINLLLGLLTTPIITRIVDPAEYGKFNIFNTYVELALAVCFLGLDNGIVRYFYNSKTINDKRSLLKLCFISPIIAASIVSISFYSLIKLKVIDVIFDKYTIILLCAYVLVNIWDRFSTLILRLTYRTKEYSLCTVIQKVVYCIIVFFYIFAIKNCDLSMLVVSSLLSILASAIFATYITRDNWDFKNVQIPTNSKEIFKYSLPFIAFTCIDSLLDSIDKLTIEELCSEYEVGIYGSALALVAIFITIKKIFETIWVPMQTEHYSMDEDGKDFIQKGNKYITLIMFFVGINIVLFKDVISIFLGESYREASQLFPFLFLGQTMYAISDTTVSGIDYSKKSYLHIVAGGFALIVDLVLNLYLVKNIGIKGAAISTCVALLVFYIFRTFFSIKNYYIDYKISKTLIMFTLVFAYCYLSTSLLNLVANIVSYIVIMVIFYVLYRKDINEFVFILIEMIKDKFV